MVPSLAATGSTRAPAGEGPGLEHGEGAREQMIANKLKADSHPPAKARQAPGEPCILSLVLGCGLKEAGALSRRSRSASSASMVIPSLTSFSTQAFKTKSETVAVGFLASQARTAAHNSADACAPISFLPAARRFAMLFEGY